MPKAKLTFEKLKIAAAKRQNILDPEDEVGSWDFSNKIKKEAEKIEDNLLTLSDPEGLLDTIKRDTLSNEIMESLADISVYSALLSRELALNLDDAIIKKFNKTSENNNIEVKL